MLVNTWGLVNEWEADPPIITPDCYNYIASKINDRATVMTGPIGEFTLLASKIDEFEAISGKITEFTVTKGGLCCGSTH